MALIGGTVFAQGYGFLSLMGPKLADWEQVPFPSDYGLDEYEIKIKTQRKHH